MIEKLFTSRGRVKILGFLFFERNKSYLREISKGVGVSVGSVKREIDNLVEVGIVLKRGRAVELNEGCSFLEDLRNVFLKSDFLVYPIRGVLDGLDLDVALIYGSYAKGDFNSESDVDLLVIGGVAPSRVYALIDGVEDKVGRDVNVVVWDRDELARNKGKSFVRDILKNKKIMIIGGEDEFERFVE